MRFMTLAAIAAAACAGLAACNPGPTTFSSGQQMQAQSVQYGTISNVRLVETQAVPGGVDRVAGAVVGGAAGNAIGNEIGGGSGRRIARGVGTVAGAVAGDRAAQAINRQTSSQWTVTLDNGQMLAVIQNDASLRVGARVAVFRDGTNTRLALAN